MPNFKPVPGKDYFALLGVSPRATTEEVREAWRRLAAAAHPDRHPEAVGAATRRLQLLNEARDVLCDPVRRRIYEVTWLKDEPVTAAGKAAGQAPRAEWERKRHRVRDRDFSYYRYTVRRHAWFGVERDFGGQREVAGRVRFPCWVIVLAMFMFFPLGLGLWILNKVADVMEESGKRQ